MFPNLLTKIDELTRGDHWYLSVEDECSFFGEYTARAGFEYSDTNDLILNLKKSPEKRGQLEWKYKNQVILQAGLALRTALPEETLAAATFVPIPPSKVKGDPLFDDRILQVLNRMANKSDDVDIRELILQDETMIPSHERENDRPGPEEISENYKINEVVAEPWPKRIVIFDDMLTTGAHFKAAKMKMTERFPGISVEGIFLARRVP